MAENVLVTGASGFVGSRIAAELARRGRPVLAASRRTTSIAGTQHVPIPDIGPDSNWRALLRGTDAVVHCAARVHVMRANASDAAALYQRVNAAGTLALARQAADAGVRRFVFLSTIKVNGERTSLDRPFSERDSAAPQDDYARSKHEAEEGLRAIAAGSSLEVTTLRPVLVHGPDVGANFRAMLRWLERGVPLPFGSVRNRRSLIALDNLVDLVITCIDHPGAANDTFLAADGEDVSTPQLLRMAAAALGTRARLFSVPPAVLRALAHVTGNRAAASRLLDSLRADISHARARLGWTPPLTFAQGLEATASGRRTRAQR